jgi:hypothetical protein
MAPPVGAQTRGGATAIARDAYLTKTCGGTGVAQLSPQRLVRADPNGPNVSAADLAAERKVIADIDRLLAAWQPNGFVVASQAGYLNNPQGSSGDAGYGNNYTYDLVSYIYDCVDGKWRKDAENGTFLLLFVNSGISAGVDGLPKINMEDASADRLGYYQLGAQWIAAGQMPQSRNGYYEFISDDDGSTSFWFTRNGELPFQYVPREEFIRRQIDILQASKAASEKRMTDAQKQWTASGVKVPDSVAAQHARMTQTMYDKPMAYYRQLLERPAAWLLQPTYCMMGNDRGRVDYTRCDFLDAAQPRAQVPIKPNPGYFDRARPKSAPQYMVIDLRAYGHAEAASRQRALIEANAAAFLALIK